MRRCSIRLFLTSPQFASIDESNTNPMRVTDKPARGNLAGTHVSMHEPTSGNCPSYIHMLQQPREDRRARTRAKMTISNNTPKPGKLDNNAKKLSTFHTTPNVGARHHGGLPIREAVLPRIFNFHARRGIQRVRPRGLLSLRRIRPAYDRSASAHCTPEKVHPSVAVLNY